MMLILTGLTTIPKEMYESASMDGAGWFRRLFFITVPMIKPAIMSVLTLGFVYTFKVFDLAWVMTKGGPVNATQLVSTYSYRLSFEELLFSQGAAAANVLFVILLVVGFFYIRTIDDSEVM
jgi:multiple sugar transport system permease protein